MSALHNTESVHPASSIRRHFVLFCLLTGGTALLLAWLSVGLAPSTWWLLFQAIRQFNILWIDQRTSLLWSLLLLIVQSLLLLAAWVLLIRVAVREGSRLYAMLPERAKQFAVASNTSVAATMPAPSSSAPISPLLLEAPMQIQPAWTAQVSDQLREQDILPPPVQTFPARQHTHAQFQSVHKTRLASSKQLTEAAELIRNISEFPTPMNALPSPDTLALSQETSLDYPVQLSFPSQQSNFVPGQTKSIEQTGQTSSSGEASWIDPYEEFNPYAAVNDIFGQEEQIAFPEQRSTKQDKPISHATDTPFAVQENMLKQFQQQESFQESFQKEAGQPEEQEPPAEEEEQLFVFGNPFEGPLPDVFEQDEDLRRSIQEGIKSSPTQTAKNQHTRGGSNKPSRLKPPAKPK